MNAKEIYGLMKDPSEADKALIEKAYNFANKAHEGQKRFSGEPYFVHLVEVGKNLAKMNMDSTTVAAGILHDTLEDADISEEDFEKEFGIEILFLVKGVTKLGKLKYRGLERHVESLRKFFIATGQDARVLVIKLADRLHNVMTLEHVREEKRKRIAIETLEIYAPIANRLGMGKIKGELEDYSFMHAFPNEYKKVNELLKEKINVEEGYIEKIHRSIQKELAKNNITHAHIDRRIKHIFSLYNKLKRNNMDIDKIYDIFALRIVVDNVEECYRTLGIIHSVWKPLPGRIKDYIALPKPNGYRSLHTTVFTGDGGMVEIQIRTKEMHDEAELGIASHSMYKEIPSLESTKNADKKLLWIKQLAEWQKHDAKSDEYLKSLKTDFFNDRVFVFTPKGDVIDLPDESSPLDFAYAIHSDVGDHVSSVRINGKMASLNTKLKNADIVEIITKSSNHPSRKWLDYAKTTMARKRIKLYLQEQNPILMKLFRK